MKLFISLGYEVLVLGPVFSTSLRNISLPTLVASGNRGLKYS
jgi:hypothetical protein